LAADQKKFIVEYSSLLDTIAPSPASELTVDSTNNTTVDTLENEEQVMVDE
jgi:hypothetical protein